MVTDAGKDLGKLSEPGDKPGICDLWIFYFKNSKFKKKGNIPYIITIFKCGATYSRYTDH
jgi:hypothetical protein